MPTSKESKITIEEFEELARTQIPFASAMGGRLENVSAGRAVYRLPYTPHLLRPGGSIIGPALMGAADLAMFAAVLTLIGRVEMALTVNLNINFLRRPGKRDVLAEARILRLGRRLAFGEVTMCSEGEGEPVAHATVCYSIPSMG
ncbi:MAG: PaaI family thioesterase [Alphaproteobacteria bacterium]|nr:PaaI family thioesterase [Alphaproteobacteria bacterium]